MYIALNKKKCVHCEIFGPVFFIYFFFLVAIAFLTQNFYIHKLILTLIPYKQNNKIDSKYILT